MATATHLSPRVVYEGKARFYIFNKKRYPSVTTVINQFFPFWEGVDADTMRAAQERGTEVHQAVAELTRRKDRTRAVAKTHSYLRGYCESWLKFMEATQLKVVTLEHPLVSDSLRVAGRPDLICEMDLPTIVDFTIGSTRDAKRLQTAAYLLIWKEMQKDRRKYDRIEVPLREDGRLPVLRPHDNPHDMDAFKDVVDLYRWQDGP